MTIVSDTKHTKYVQTTLPTEMHKKLSIFCLVRGVSLTALLRQIITDWADTQLTTTTTTTQEKSKNGKEKTE